MNIFTPTIAWETYAKDVENSPTGEHYFYLTVSSINPNDYGVDQKEVGDYFIDYLGFCYEITDLNIEGNPNRIEVYEITEGANYPQGLTKPPYPEMNGFVYRPLNDAIILTQAQLRRLHSSAKDVIQPLENAALATQDQLLSVGKIYPDPTYIDNGDGTIIIKEAEIALHDNPNGTGQIKIKTFKETTLTLTDNSVNYVIAAWNNPNDEFEITPDVNIIDESDVAPIFTIVRTGTVLHILNWDSMGTNLVNKLHQRLVKTERFARQSGLSLEVTPTRVMNIAPGIVWYGARSISLDGVNSTDNFCFLYYHQAGEWTSTPVTQFPNTQYDDGTDLQTMNNNYYSSVFVLRGVEDANYIYLVLGNNQYNRASDAEDAEVPPLPDIVQAHSILVGKIVFEKNIDTPINVLSVFEKFFSYSSIADHGNLTGLRDDDHLQYVKLDGRLGDILKIDTINEYTTDNGVDIEGVKIKDGFIDWSFISNKPEFTSEYLVKEITQASHGFNNDFIYHNGTQWVKAQADDVDTCATHFAISTDIDTFNLIPVGELSNVTITDEVGDPLIVGDYYFLSQTTPGKITATQPSTGIVQSVLKSNSANNVTILVDDPYLFEGGSSFIESPLTTKGDIWTYTSNDARLGVGVDGQILSADSTTPTGLKWIDASSGGFNNYGSAHQVPVMSNDGSQFSYSDEFRYGLIHNEFINEFEITINNTYDDEYYKLYFGGYPFIGLYSELIRDSDNSTGNYLKTLISQSQEVIQFAATDILDTHNPYVLEITNSGIFLKNTPERKEKDVLYIDSNKEVSHGLKPSYTELAEGSFGSTSGPGAGTTFWTISNVIDGDNFEFSSYCKSNSNDYQIWIKYGEYTNLNDTFSITGKGGEVIHIITELIMLNATNALIKSVCYDSSGVIIDTHFYETQTVINASSEINFGYLGGIYDSGDIDIDLIIGKCIRNSNG